MAQTQLIGGSGVGVIVPSIAQAVDPLYQAARIALRPLDYSDGRGNLLGHYATFQKSGASVNIGAAGHIGRIRWAPTVANTYAVLMRLKVGWAVTGAITAAVVEDYDAIIHRGYTVDHTVAITAVNMATVPRSNAMRATMGSSFGGSLMGANGPGICTTAVISGNTSTADNAPFCGGIVGGQPSGNATVTQAVAVSYGMQTLYEYTSPAQHPVVLSNNEGVVVRKVAAGNTDGTKALYIMWEWAECFVM